jgi:hypothetical protein
MNSAVLKQAEERKQVFCNDNLDSVSQVSAMTPKTSALTYISDGTKMEADKQSQVSKASKKSTLTTVSTKERMAQLEAELKAERDRRIKAEQTVETLKMKK